MWELGQTEGWVPKNRYFWTMVLEKTLDGQCTARRSNQSILKEISPEYSWEGLTLKLNSKYVGMWWEELTHGRRPWHSERLGAGGEEGDRGWDGSMVSLTHWAWVWAKCVRWERTGKPGMLQSMALQWVCQNLVTEHQEQKTEHLCTESCKTAIKEIKDNTNRRKCILCTWIGRINIVKNAPKNLEVKCKPYQAANDVFSRTRTKTKIKIWKQTRPRRAKAVFYMYILRR